MRKLVIVLIAAIAILAPMQAAEATAAKFAVTSSASTTSFDLGKSFVLSGTVSPNAKGKTVKIQRQYVGGAWTTILTKTLSSTSKYSATIKPSKAGPTNYRVLKPSSSARAQGVSPVRAISIYRWRYLLDLPNTRNPSTVFDGTVLIKGYAFTKSFSLKQEEYVTWNLNGKGCDKVKTYIGIDDDSVSDTTGKAYILNQSYDYINYESGLAVGQSARYVQAGLSGSTSITLLPNVVASSSQAWVAYGSPQVHCNS